VQVGRRKRLPHWRGRDEVLGDAAISAISDFIILEGRGEARTGSAPVSSQVLKLIELAVFEQIRFACDRL
jgi:hypothetical protein